MSINSWHEVKKERKEFLIEILEHCKLKRATVNNASEFFRHVMSGLRFVSSTVIGKLKRKKKSKETKMYRWA